MASRKLNPARVVFDGMDSVVGADADTDPTYLPSSYVSVAVNRQMRGGKNKTRPSWMEIVIQLADGQDASVLSNFRRSVFQGAYAYQSITIGTQDGIAVACGGTLYFIAIINNLGYLSKIIDGNDPDLMHTWFTQAGNLLYSQNGYQDPIMWDGTVSGASRLNPFAKEMPIGTIMAYYGGRVWLSDAKNNVYAGDEEFGNGLNDYSNTKNFTEQTYWNEGGSFTESTRLGAITGAFVSPSINLNDRGQGELIIPCEKGFFTLQGLIDRTLWKDSNIQKISMIGRGCCSPWSPTGVNNEIFFRSYDGWSLYNNAQLDFQRNLSFRKISKEVNYWVDGDTPWMRQFASAMFFNNRLIATVSPYTVVAEDMRGLHRPHRAMIVLDVDQSTNAAPDAQTTVRWNGLWEGPQPTQLLTAQINGEQRGFCFSFDADGVNRLYEIRDDLVGDYGAGETQKIRSAVITKRFDFSPSQQTNRFLSKEICGAEMFLSDVSEAVQIDLSYRPDNYPCWQDWGTTYIGCDTCDEKTKDCLPTSSQHRSGKRKFSTPPGRGKIPQIGMGIPTVQGSEFQLKIEMEGRVTIDRIRINASLNPIDSLVGDCPTKPQDCTPIECCPFDALNYYRIVN